MDFTFESIKTFFIINEKVKHSMFPLTSSCLVCLFSQQGSFINPIWKSMFVQSICHLKNCPIPFACLLMWESACVSVCVHVWESVWVGGAVSLLMGVLPRGVPMGCQQSGKLKNSIYTTKQLLEDPSFGQNLQKSQFKNNFRKKSI